MFYNYESISESVIVLDTNTFENIKFQEGQNCFIICHHIKDYNTIFNNSKEFIELGYSYFNIFGQQADLWDRALKKSVKSSDSIKIESSKISYEEMSYNLAMFIEMKLELKNFIVSDDYYFTEYLISDTKDILNGNTNFSVYDWAKFRQGFEFKINNKDSVVSIGNGIVIGYLGKEETYNTLREAFEVCIFDGMNFFEVWKELNLYKK